MRIGTLFSGGLAACEFALRYEDLEHEVVFACEWDKYARQQYLEFHEEPGAFYNDVSEMCGKKYLNTIDLMVWGSPCQDLSLAGKRKGFDGEKSSLFREGARIMSEVMPKAFIFENVKGLLSSNSGNDYKEVVKTFQDMGYLIASKVVNAKEHGTAQNRERVFIVGFLDVEEYHAFNFAEPIPLAKVLRDYLDDEVEEKYYLSQKMIDGFISHGARHKEKGTGFQWQPKDENDIANYLRANAAICPTDNTIKVGFINQDTQASSVFTSDGVSPSLCSGTHGYAQGYIQEPQLNQVGELDIKGADSVKRVYGDNGLCPTLTTMGGGNRQPKVLEPTVAIKSATKNGYEIATENDSINLTHPGIETRRGRVGKSVAQTLDCACNQGVIESKISLDIKDSVRKNFVRDYANIIKSEKTVWYCECDSGFQDNKVCLTESACLRANNSDLFALDNQYRIRRLTPKECFRLQGINDSDINLVNSDTQSYKIAGNAIEVNSMRMLIRQLYKAEKPKGSLF